MLRADADDRTAALASRLKRARQASQLTQETVARATGIPRTALSYIEQGTRSVSAIELDRLARLYGRTAEELLADQLSASGSDRLPAVLALLSPQDRAAVETFARFPLHEAARFPVQRGEQVR